VQQTQPATWHLHVDGHRSPPAFQKWCVESGFTHANFCGHPPEYEHFEPTDHWTMKFNDRQKFEEAFARACARAETDDFVGYLEGEYITRVIEIPEIPYTDMPPPFHVERRLLTADEQFRQGEFHLTFDADTSDPRRIMQLLDMGLYGAYEMKVDGRRYLVLTMQGYMRDILKMSDTLQEFLGEAGGLSRARLKVEKAVAWKLFGIAVSQLPPIAGRVI
jgi:hypothetical protein